MGNNKWVHLIFVGGGFTLAFVLVHLIEWIWGYFGHPYESVALGSGTFVAAVATYIAWRNERVFTGASEVVNELSRVSWPARKETTAATIVVIVTTVVISLILGVFDAWWSWATSLIYG